MASSIQASEQGLAQIDHLRRLKGWNKYDQAWSDLALTTPATLKRFWKGQSIQQEIFAKICEEVGCKDWQSIVLSNIDSNRSKGKTSTDRISIEGQQNIGQNDGGVVIFSMQGGSINMDG